MNQQTIWLTLAACLAVVCGLTVVLEWLRRWAIRKLTIISAKELNDCKPACFMIHDKDDLT